MAHPVKSFASRAEQITLLRGRGLDINDAQANQWLRSVGYYRLSGYWYPYRELEPSGSRSDHFIPGTAFDDVVRLYEFDRKLRTLVHDGIERIEVALRTHTSEHLGRLGPLAYKDPANFRPSFDHRRWLATALRRVARARTHSEPVRHHEGKYEGKLPVWVLSDLLDFADVSILYEGLPAFAQRTIAEDLGVAVDVSQLSKNQRSKTTKMHPLVRWFEHLTIIRNTSAHHSRLWNRSFTPVATPALRTIPALRSLPQGQSERVYGALTLMAHLLDSVSPGTTWRRKVRGLVEDSLAPLPYRSVEEMGFPANWRQQHLWCDDSPN